MESPKIIPAFLGCFFLALAALLFATGAGSTEDGRHVIRLLVASAAVMGLLIAALWKRRPPQ